MCAEHTTWFKLFPRPWQRGKGVLSNILHERYLEHHQALQEEHPSLYIFMSQSSLFPDIHTLVNFVLKAMNAQRPGNKASHNSSATTSISTTLSYNLYLQSPPHNLYHTPSGL